MPLTCFMAPNKVLDLKGFKASLRQLDDSYLHYSGSEDPQKCANPLAQRKHFSIATQCWRTFSAARVLEGWGIGPGSLVPVGLSPSSGPPGGNGGLTSTLHT